MKPSLAAKSASTLLVVAGVLLPLDAIAQSGAPTRGLFCTAEGYGVWAGRTVPFRYQSSLLAPGTSNDSDTLTLYADEQTAGVFGITGGAGAAAGAGLAFDGATGLPPRSSLVATIGPDLSFRVVFTDWKNPGAVATGRCEWNYGS